MQTDKQTEGHENLTNALRNFVNAPKNISLCVRS